jgi:hypothetical protein
LLVAMLPLLQQQLQQAQVAGQVAVAVAQGSSHVQDAGLDNRRAATGARCELA